MCQSWVFGLIWPLNRLPHSKLLSQKGNQWGIDGEAMGNQCVVLRFVWYGIGSFLYKQVELKATEERIPYIMRTALRP